MRGLKSVGDHSVFVVRDIGVAGTAEVEYASRVHRRPGITEIASHEAAQVFGERHAEIASSLASTSLYLRFQRNLSTRHHDGAIIAYLICPALRAGISVTVP
jgi:hypothetical protein